MPYMKRWGSRRRHKRPTFRDHKLPVAPRPQSAPLPPGPGPLLALAPKQPVAPAQGPTR